MDNRYDFSLDTINKGHHNIHYRGIKTVKCPFDYVLYQMIVNEIKPDLIIEIGTAFGGSALYLADLLESINNGIIHTIDLDTSFFDTNLDSDKEIINNHRRIKRFLGGYQNYDLSNTIGFDKILIIEDGSHQYQDVINVLHKFSSLVSKDSYIIVEDGAVDWLNIEGFNGGPLRAIEEFLLQNSNFKIDRHWCDFFGYNATFNPNGYLKKINNYGT